MSLGNSGSLQSICFQRILQFLCEDKYCGCGIYFQRNPFSILPHVLVNELFSRVVEMPDISLRILMPLLCSGQMTMLRLPPHVRISTTDFVQMIRFLEPFAVSLLDISIDTLCPQGAAGQKDCALAIESLLTAARSLRFLHISLPFNLRALRYLKNLEFLEVNAIVIKSALKIKKSTLRRMRKLHHVYMDQCSQQVLNENEVVAILESCPQLLTLKNDMAEALDHLCNLFIPLPKYNLQRMVLGKSIPSGVTLRQVHLASLVCPNVVELDIFISDGLALLQVFRMHNLRVLRLQWVGHSSSFERALVPCLRIFQGHLKNLLLSGFTDIAFDTLMRYCSDLEELDVTGVDRFDHLKMSSNFLFLRILNISFSLETQNDAAALYQILFTQTPRLEKLRIVTSNSFVAEDFLGGWEQLSHLTLHKCRMSADSYVRLIRHCPSLKLFYFSASPDLCPEDIQFIRTSLSPTYNIKNLSFCKWKIFRVSK